MASTRLRVCTLAVVLMLVVAAACTALVATGTICITSTSRLPNRYKGEVIAPMPSDPAPDADADGVADNDDILVSALAYVRTRPRYKSAYYTCGYPDDQFGVCTDVLAFACRDAGYDLQLLVAADIASRPDAYAISVPDAAIDFRRTPNLKVFLDAHAQSLTTDLEKVGEWCGGDIVLYDGHVGIASDRRNTQGTPYLIHHSSPFQLRYEEDCLESYGHIVGHYRLDPSCLTTLT